MKIKASAFGRKLEDLTVYALFILTALLLLAEVAARIFFNTGVKNSSAYVQQTVLAAAFLAGAVASREKKHLSLAAAFKVSGKGRIFVEGFLGVLSGSFTFAFALSSLLFALTAFSPSEKTGFLPKQLTAMVMFLGFSLMAVRFFSGMKKGKMRLLLAGLSLLLGMVLTSGSVVAFVRILSSSAAAFLEPARSLLQSSVASVSVYLILILVASAFLGLPIFVVLGGIALLLFARAGQPLEVIANQAYSVLTDYSIPAIPLFALVGFLLSESRASERLVAFFRYSLGWIPGGLTLMSVVVCAFFTTFTGGSGITILALGGLLFRILSEEGYPAKFSVGLLTSSGSIGLLFPPSLPIIIYGVTAGVSIKDMFVGGLLPGTAIMLAVVIVGVAFSRRAGVRRHESEPKRALKAFVDCAWELLLPVLIIVLYFGGITNLQESAAFALAYVLIVDLLIKKDLRLRHLPGVFSAGARVFGGVLIILALANGFSYYIIDTQLPQRLSAWVGATISSPIVFLLILNAVLLVVGCFMDIYSAILVVVPLIIPLGAVFHIHPVHLGIIFLANMELGYLTPPVGLNLFLASYRFERPMASLYRDVLVFLLIMLAAVLLITYVPALTTAFLPAS